MSKAWMSPEWGSLVQSAGEQIGVLPSAPQGFGSNADRQADLASTLGDGADSQTFVYVCRGDETYGALAEAAGGDWQAIVALNPDVSPSALSSGTALKLPRSWAHAVGGTDPFFVFFRLIAEEGQADEAEVHRLWAHLTADERALILKHPQTGEEAREILGIPHETPVEEASAFGAGWGLGGWAARAEETWDQTADTTAVIADTAAEWWWGSETEAEVAPEATLAPEPEAIEEEISTPSTESTYISQLDNTTSERTTSGIDGKSATVSKYNLCNVTTLAMQALSIAGGPQEEPRLKGIICDIMADRCGQEISAEVRDQKTLPDLIYHRFSLWSYARWQQAVENKEGTFSAFNGKKYWQALGGIAHAKDGRFHQIHTCLNFVLDEFLQFGLRDGVDAIWDGSVSYDQRHEPDYFKTVAQPVLEAGGAISMGTILTGGHVVMLVEVLDDGIIVHDPYGLKLQSGQLSNGKTSNGYLTNGLRRSRTDQLLRCLDPDESIRKRRTRHAPGLLPAISEGAEGALPNDMGRSNFFSYEEVKQYRMTCRTFLRVNAGAPSATAEP